MSGRQAKAGRRAGALRDAIVQAHDRLHRDDVDGCHELLHQALGAGKVTSSDVAPFGDSLLSFDDRFRRAAIEAGARAAYVLHMPDGRLVSGGDAEVNALVDRAVRRLLAEGSSATGR